MSTITSLSTSVESMDVLLSIKPKYVKSIIEGEKRYEFRKAIFRNREINRIFIYSSAPVKKIVALFEISTILEDNPIVLWDQVRDHAGIEDSEFFSYFAGRSRGTRSESRTFMSSMNQSIHE